MDAQHVQVCVMGVSAAGKSTVGLLLTQRLDAAFIDADDLHPVENTTKMAAGRSLTDDDRWVWLDAVGARFADAAAHGRDLVIACSALARRYRDRIRSAAPGVVFVHLHGDAELLAQRAGDRREHFMPAALLASQIEALEPLAPDEPGVTLDVAESPSALAARAVAWLGRHPA
ncbi:gluconokinase [Microbacterium sp. NPDC055910]|uniref:gluconokinase n=1 Tax=Microbacterium sp. NPDC055910 TaxID=3345659 RepID=UPI0035E28350